MERRREERKKRKRRRKRGRGGGVEERREEALVQVQQASQCWYVNSTPCFVCVCVCVIREMVVHDRRAHEGGWGCKTLIG